MIDMDDVITKGGFLYLINDFQNTNYTEKDFDSYYMQEKINDKNGFYKYLKAHNMYDYCNIIDGAYDIIKKLNEKYEIFIGTSYIIHDFLSFYKCFL